MIALRESGGVVATYSYDAAGNRLTYSSGDATTTYTYDGLGRPLTAVSSTTVALTVDASQTSYQAYDEDGFGNGERTPLTVRETLQLIALQQYHDVNQWTRIAADNGLAGATLDGDANTLLGGRVLNITHSNEIDWTYDKAGNTVLYVEKTDGATLKTIRSEYDGASHNTLSVTDITTASTLSNDDANTLAEYMHLGYGNGGLVNAGSTSSQSLSQQFGGNGQVSRATLHTYGGGNKDKNYYYVYTYTGDGRQLGVKASGDASGTVTFSYDVDDNLVKVNQGKGDGMDRAEISNYVYDNAGQILAKYHDDGRAAVLRDKLDYVYVNGHPVAQTGVSIAAGGAATVLDSANYALFQNYDKDYPAASVSAYTVQAGETLQSIADAVYGDKSLWYVIAGANGMGADTELKAGQVLTLPAAASSNGVSSTTHKVYSQSEVVGGTLPNLTATPPKHHGCSGLLKILVIVVAIVVTIYTAGAASEFLGAAAGGTAAGGAAATGAAVGGAAATGAAVGGAAAAGAAVGGVAAGSIAGTFAAGAAVLGGAGGALGVAAAVVGGAVGSIVSQAVAIGVGLQDSFSWKGVAISAIASGVGAGLGQGSALANAPAGTAGVPLVTSGAGQAAASSSFFNAGTLGAVERAAAGNAITQGVEIVTGLQNGFNFRGVAAAAAAAGVSSYVSNQVGEAQYGADKWAIIQRAGESGSRILGDDFASNLVRQTVSGVAGGVTQQLITTGKVDWSGAAINSVGGALGQSIGDYVSARYELNSAGLGNQNTQLLIETAARQQRASADPQPISITGNSATSVATPLDILNNLQKIPEIIEGAEQSATANRAIAPAKEGDATVPNDQTMSSVIAGSEYDRSAIKATGFPIHARFIDTPTVDGNPILNGGDTSPLPALDGVIDGVVNTGQAPEWFAKDGSVIPSYDGVIDQVVIPGKKMPWYEKLWGYVTDFVAGGDGSLVDAGLNGAASPSYRGNFDFYNATQEKKRQLSETKLTDYKLQHPVSYAVALGANNINASRAQSFEQQTAHGLLVPVQVGAQASSDIGTGAAKIGSGDYVGGGLQLAGGALTFVPLPALGRVANLLRSEESILGRELNDIIKNTSTSARAFDVLGLQPPLILKSDLDTVVSASTALSPKVDVTDLFVATSNKNGSTTIRYGSPEGLQGLIVNVDKNGLLGFDIRADRSVSSNPSGSDMFISAMQRLDQEGIQVNSIRGTWLGNSDSVNTAEYISNLKNGMESQQAAANTWTGRMAAKYGFTDVGVPTSSMFNDATVVIFKKPK